MNRTLGTPECLNSQCSAGTDHLYQSVKSCAHIILYLFPLVLETHNLSLKTLLTSWVWSPNFFNNKDPFCYSPPWVPRVKTLPRAYHNDQNCLLRVWNTKSSLSPVTTSVQGYQYGKWSDYNVKQEKNIIVIMFHIYWVLTVYARHCAECIIYVIQFNPHHTLMRWDL